MEKQRSDVVLFGHWVSTFTHRVEIALKVKGISYEYVEEDLTNKSDLLLHYNPVHKKVPVLVHKGKPIAESLLILQYIDDCWNHAPKLLPKDPYQRAKTLCWANFYDQELLPSVLTILSSEGKEQEKAMAYFSELLRVFEEGIAKDFAYKSLFLNGGDHLGFVDIVVAANSCNYQAFEEALSLDFDLKNHQAFLSWITALQGNPLVKQTLPPYDKLRAKIKEKFLLLPQV